MKWLDDNVKWLIGLLVSAASGIGAFLLGFKELFDADPLTMALALACSFALGWAVCWIWADKVSHSLLFGKVRRLDGVMLGVVKDAYPDGISMSGRSDAEWEAINQLVDAGILSTSERGVVTDGTRYALTVDAMNAIRAHERRFRRL